MRELTEGEAGDESQLLADIFGTKLEKDEQAWRTSYTSMLQVAPTVRNLYEAFTPRLFVISSLYGRFELCEQLNPLRTPTLSCSFPFHQQQLYEESKQPTLFMLDTCHELYVWQGWLEEAAGDESDAGDESAKLRLAMSRRCALRTAINYWNVKYSNVEDDVARPLNGFIVYAGLEPLEFTNLFPMWRVNEAARACNLRVCNDNSSRLLLCCCC